MPVPSLHKRRRPVRSCLVCRARRVRCDQLRPACTNCVKAGASCEYPAPSEEPAGHSQTPPAASTAGMDIDRAAASHGSHRDELTTQADDLGYLGKTSDGRGYYWGPSFWGLSGRELPEFNGFIDHQAADGPDPSPLCEGCKHLRHWDASEQRSIVRLLTDEALRCNRIHGLGQMFNRLPQRETCNQLWAQFIATVYPLVPILHLPTFWRQIDSFWSSIEHHERTGVPDGVLAECPAFLALVFSTLCCGALSACSGPHSDSSVITRERRAATRLSRNLYRAAMQTLTICGFPRNPTVASLQAFVICHIPLIREESQGSVSFVSTAFRVGQALGLHRDPKHFNMGPVEGEVRRRLWWHILHKDALSSSVSGFPQMMWNRQQHDTAMISELQDFKLGQAPVEIGQSRMQETGGLEKRPRAVVLNGHTAILDYRDLGESVDVRQLVSVGRFLITNIMRDILGRQTDLEPWTAAEVVRFRKAIDETVTQVKGRIEALEHADDEELSINDVQTDLSNEDRITEMRNQSIHAWGTKLTSQSSAFAAWSRQLLHLMIAKTHCTLYHPLQKGSDRTLWLQFRETAIAQFHAYIEQYVHLCTEPSFAHFYWMYPGNYQPLQAMAVILVDLLDFPTSSEAAESRRLVDCIFSLLGGDSGVVVEQAGHLMQRSLPASGKECWAMLGALRRKAWRAMGIDPSVIWTCARKHDHEAHESEESDDESEEDEMPQNQPEERRREESTAFPTDSPFGLAPANEFDFGLEYGINFDDLFVGPNVQYGATE